ncbi:hypothetical protein BS47DRAFT_1347359 [Hydnum rufescens UP504]|uniref:Alanine dehydrogenase/pyridine nucleotide transhydrogenase N-terminal domain-containing protein n=1 Tax=Hydnum rufescens UP504 TaxID=1448309 RepID=A0A9P6AS02_9AGAM|nr:hypothetical protein BS47DRAFT_1347359 [Hydnum rufescens UP504]
MRDISLQVGAVDFLIIFSAALRGSTEESWSRDEAIIKPLSVSFSAYIPSEERLNMRRLSTLSRPPCGFARRELSSTSLSVGLRREDPARLWERRAPLTPAAVYSLVRNGVQIIVQGCERRVFSDKEYASAGAKIGSSLESCSIILGIKEVPLNELLTSQPHLIDYEQITDKNAKRTVAFGFFAGSAGVIEGLLASALDLLSLGIASPFLHLPRAYTNRTLQSMKGSLRLVGDHVASHGTPSSAGPFVIAVTGNGNVVKGALDMLQNLPIRFVTPEQLPRLVYVVHALPSSYIFRHDGARYSRSAYYARPSDYESRFHEIIAPYISVLINGAGWQPGFPRLMSNEQLALALHRAAALGKARFRSVSDISCDVNGGLEFVSKATTIDDPFYIARPSTFPPNLRGVQVMAIDILPSEVPFDASEYFSQALLPYLRALLRYERERHGLPTTEDLGDVAERLSALKRATIAENGELTESHRWLYEPLRDVGLVTLPPSHSAPSVPPSPSSPSSYSPSSVARSHTNAPPKVLLFGSGMVAKPFCQTILDHGRKNGDVQLVCEGIQRASAVEVDIADKVKNADIVASLLPAPLHPIIAEHCITHGKHLVTASYISSAMQDLNRRALEADVLLLNEIGLDPGLDHLSAMELKSSMANQGKRIVSFTSWCGGLPAPEFSNVPLGMKFSWSPRALLSAALNDARFKMANKIYSIRGQDLLSSFFPDVPLAKGFALEGLANRDTSGPLNTLETTRCRRIGLLNVRDDSKVALDNWSELCGKVLAATTSNGAMASSSVLSLASLKSALVDVLPSPARTESAIEALEALSIIPGKTARISDTSLPPIPKGRQTPLDLLAAILSHKLRYQPHERDLVILSHEIVTVPSSISEVPPPDSLHREVHQSTLVVYGDAHLGSAMSRTVGLPLAFAALRILKGEVHVRGVRAPVDSETAGIIMRETSSRGSGMAEGLAKALSAPAR